MFVVRERLCAHPVLRRESLKSRDLDFFWTDFRKIFRYQILWNSVQWEPSCSIQTDGRTYGQTEVRDGVNIRFSQFCEHDRKMKGIFCFNYWECSNNYGYLKTRNDVVFMWRTVGLGWFTAKLLTACLVLLAWFLWLQPLMTG